MIDNMGSSMDPYGAFLSGQQQMPTGRARRKPGLLQGDGFMTREGMRRDYGPNITNPNNPSMGGDTMRRRKMGNPGMSGMRTSMSMQDRYGSYMG